MKYILLAAGRGTRLHPLTKNCPKCLFNIDTETTIAQMLINNIRHYDSDAHIIMVTGFMTDLITETIKGCDFIYNPFYDCTNSIASLWFARHHLQGHVTIINADIVAESALIKDIVSKEFEQPIVLLDSSIKTDGDYNVQVKNEEVIVMSKNLKEYFAEYAGITKLPPESTILLHDEICSMIKEGYYDQWYENALVQMIFNKNFQLLYCDIANYNWTEVDCVDDLLKAKEICNREKVRIDTTV